MTRRTAVRHEFTDVIPDRLQDGVVYISVRYATVLHLCCCGCRSEVVTPLSPDGWSVTFDGQSVSLSPSIGNWSFRCQSHYWITRNKVRWAHRWSQEEIAAARRGRPTAQNRAAGDGQQPAGPGGSGGAWFACCTGTGASPERHGHTRRWPGPRWAAAEGWMVTSQ